MSDSDGSIAAMLRERLRIVQEVSRLTARHLLNQQIAGGADFAIMRMEGEREDGETPEARAAALREELQRRDAARSAMVADDIALAGLESQIEELDRRIAAVERE
ncbi:hypothetical protein [Labrys monachus]|uniref:Uncharacterized small protein (DUF1192 family) n=1 Tax=Labrys monachus TaxID=217067 RepID=A0ABU0FBD6_9HYPH|nr:hypothetical protein [Labrys monachus]MDQ0391931.1 uncharacterized small protein (DUF1192 family) [Labrys monachus]